MPTTDARVMSANLNCLRVATNTLTPVAGAILRTAMEISEDRNMAEPAAVPNSQRKLAAYTDGFETIGAVLKTIPSRKGQLEMFMTR